MSYEIVLSNNQRGTYLINIVFLYLVFSILPPEWKIQNIFHGVYIQPKGAQNDFP